MWQLVEDGGEHARVIKDPGRTCQLYNDTKGTPNALVPLNGEECIHEDFACPSAELFRGSLPQESINYE